MYFTVCRLTLHEGVFFASREAGRLYETERYLHNYALTYALGLATSTYFHAQQVPSYASELAGLNERGIYVTPAHPLRVGFALNTFKYGNNNYHADAGKSKTNTPTFGRLKELAVGSQFEFAVLSPNTAPNLPKWIRLGLWLGKAEVEVMSTQMAKATLKQSQRASYPMNPLDLPIAATLFDLIPMPPVSLLDHVEINADGWEIVTQNGKRWLPQGLSYQFL